MKKATSAHHQQVHRAEYLAFKVAANLHFLHLQWDMGFANVQYMMLTALCLSASHRRVGTMTSGYPILSCWQMYRF